MKAVNSQTRNEKATRSNGWQSLEAQIDKTSTFNSPVLKHLSTSKWSDEMTEHLVSAIVMRSLLQLERRAA